MSKNGDMFCMPLNHSKVLRMKPISSNPTAGMWPPLPVLPV